MSVLKSTMAESLMNHQRRENGEENGNNPSLKLCDLISMLRI